MSRRGLSGKDVLLKKSLSHELLQVFSEHPTLDGWVSLAFVVRVVLLKPGERWVILERYWASNLWLVFEGVENYGDRELQWSEAFHRSIFVSEFGERFRSACFL